MSKDEWTDFEKYLIKRIDLLEEKVTTLRITSGVFGGISGLIVSFITWFFCK